MELWIRSQDKWELHKAEHIRTRIDGNFFNIEVGITIVGTYKSKERALEVLDEIHKHIEMQGQDVFDKNYTIKHYGKVYEMPKE